MKKFKIRFNFTAFGQAIKAAPKARGYSTNKLADELKSEVTEHETAINGSNENKKSAQKFIASIPV